VTEEEKYMQRALDLATLGRGLVAPNPLVGCVVVADGEIIGEGWHKKYGEAHAEVNAVNAVENKQQLQKATVYVTLEPCAHFGKTPPCADLLCSLPVRKVFISTSDPNPLVAGKGIEKLKKAGVEVKTGILEQSGKALNKRFFTFIEKQRPYIILKWAETADGFIAKEDFSSKWISNELSRTLVHKWRSEEAAVLVGRNTVLQDNPLLTVRNWTGRNPRAIILDPTLRLSPNHAIFNTPAEVLIYNQVKNYTRGNNIFIKLENNLPCIPEVLKNLFERKIQSVIVEGGAGVLKSFIACGLWDEIRRFKSKESFYTGIPAPEFKGELINRESLREDILDIFHPVHKI